MARIPHPHSRQIAAFSPARLLARQATDRPNKFSHGHALIVAGGPAKGGAARLSARAALRIGAGLVTLCPPEAALPDHAGPPDALMRHPLEDAEGLQHLLQDRRITALCLGPGCGVGRCTDLLPALLSSRRPCVLDADALTALSQAPDLAGALHDSCILTPHMGEFARLFPDLAARLRAPEAPPPARYADYTDLRKMQDWLAAASRYRDQLATMRGPVFSRLDATREAAARSGAVVLLKGPDTVMAAPDGRALIHSAFDIPWLATAGAGDVLSGIITGLLARGLSPLDAAGIAVRLHAAAARQHGPGLIADDLPDTLPAVLPGETA